MPIRIIPKKSSMAVPSEATTEATAIPPSILQEPASQPDSSSDDSLVTPTSQKPGRIRIGESSVIAEGNITHVEVLEAPMEHERRAIEMLWTQDNMVDWNTVSYPFRQPVRRTSLALEMHCLLIQSDDVLDILAFWQDEKPILVEYDAEAKVVSLDD